jgi:hypothetical protein
VPASITDILGFGYGVAHWANILKFIIFIAAAGTCFSMFVYSSSALYDIINCTVPERLVQFAVEKEQKKLVQSSSDT